MSSPLPIVGRNLRRLRADRGVAASELARGAGLSRATLSELESGRGNPTLETLQTLAAELGTTVSSLLTGVDDDLIVRVGPHGGARRVAGAIDARLLHRSEVRGACVEQWQATIAESAEPQVAPAHARGVVESVYVVSGRLLAGPASAHISLGRAEALTFPADQPHVYGAIGRSANVLLTMIYPATTPLSAVISPGLGDV